MNEHKNRRRSQWRVINRCLDILIRLMRGPARGEELLNIIYQDALQEEEHLSDSRARKRFEEDRARLRVWFLIDLHYDRSSDIYELAGIDRPLIDLPDDAIHGLAFLDQTFSDDRVPMAEAVRAFLDIVRVLLPSSSHKRIEKQRDLIELKLGVRDEDEISDDVWNAIKISTSQKRRLEFDYIAASNQDGLVRRHTVEPVRYFFDTERKHYYLEGVWIESRSHLGVFSQNRAVMRFRLGRMKNAVALPNHFPPHHRLPQKELIYELTPVAARFGVTRHFPEMQIIEHADGSALVKVMSHNLFFDLRTLLHYGANCRVIGGEEAVKLMTEIVNDLARIYLTD